MKFEWKRQKVPKEFGGETSSKSTIWNRKNEIGGYYIKNLGKINEDEWWIEFAEDCAYLFLVLMAHLHLVPRSKNAWSYTFTPPLRLHGMVLS